MKRIKWVYKYKTIISTILIVALFVEPFVFLPKVGIKSNTNEPVKIISLNTASAQSGGQNSSFYSGDGSNFSGISQWGNSQFINNPDIAKALKSCANQVPSFQKKIIGLFKKKKQLQDTPTTSVALKPKASNVYGLGSSGQCGGYQDKFANSNSYGLSDLQKTLYTTDEINSCDTSKTDANPLLLGSNDQEIKVTDPGLNLKIDNLANDAAITKENTTATKEAAEGEKIRHECMDSIAYALSRQALAGITQSTVNWIETGNWDDPYYIKEPHQFFENLKKQTLKQTLGNLYDKSLDNLAQIGANADYPFLGTTYRNLLNRYASEDNFEQASKSTLGDFLIQVNGGYLSSVLMGDNANASKAQAVDNWRNDFTQGGWGAWLEATQKPQNNKAGSALMTDDYLSKKIATKETEVKQQLDNGNGFLSQTKCIEEEEVIPSKCTEYTDYQGQKIKAEDVNVDDLTTGAVTCSKITPAQTIIRTRGVTAKPNDPNCKKTEVVTPGSIIAERMKFVATTDVRQLELADQFNQSLGAVFTAAFNRLQTEGLSSLSKDKYGDWEAQARKQSFLEKYNSQFQKVGTSGSIEPKQLIIRRESTGYSSGDFDITTDLDDQQVGCVINPGIITTQTQYIAELEAALKTTVNPKTKTYKDGPLLQILPAMAELDYCIPGPTPDWELLADNRVEGLYNTLIDNPIPFVRKKDNPDYSTYYSSFAKKISELIVAQKKADNFQNNANIANGVLTIAAGICTAVCSTGYGAIVAAAVAVVGVVLKAVAWNKTKKANEEHEQFSNAAAEFEEAADWAIANEARMWTDEQITNMIQDYNLFKQETYQKFGDDNSIAVAKEARPFINSLNSYAENTRVLLDEYQNEIIESKKDLTELKAIKAEVDKIKKAATDRALQMEKDLEIKRGLPAGSLKGTLTDVPKECKPTPIQCPAPKKSNDPVIGSSNLINSINNLGLVSGLAPSGGTVNSINYNIPAPKVLDIRPSSNYTYVTKGDKSIKRTAISFSVTESVISVKATCPNYSLYVKDWYRKDYPLIKDLEVYGGGTDNGLDGGVFILDGVVSPGDTCDLTVTAPTSVYVNGVPQTTTSKATCTIDIRPVDYVLCKEFLPKTVTSKTPEIIYFTADKISIKKGESVKLQWEMTNVTHPYLTTTTNSACVNADCFNDPKDSAVVSPYTTTTYILSSGIKGTGVKQQITITVK